MSVKEHAHRLSAKMKQAMKKGEKDLGERHPDHKIFRVRPYSPKALLLWSLIGIIVASFCVTFINYSFQSPDLQAKYNFYHAALLCLLGLLGWSLPGKDEYFPMNFFAKTGTIIISVLTVFFCLLFAYLAIYHYPPLSPVLPICATSTACSVLLLSYFGSHFRLLTYDPFLHNKDYKLTRRVDKSAGNLEIIASRPFQIILKNVGIEAWKSQAGYVIKRQVTVKRRRTTTLIPIPKDLIVQSNHKITLIPETEPDREGVVKVPHFRCFGYDVGDVVLSTVGYRNPNLKKKLALLEEQFQDLQAPTEWTRIIEMVNTPSGPESVNIL